MLAQKNRISESHFRQIIEGELFKIQTRFFIIKWRYSKENESCFSVIISKKVSKQSVKRNRKRRQTYEAIRKNITLFSTPIQALFFTKQSILTASYQEIEEEIQHFCKSLS